MSDAAIYRLLRIRKEDPSLYKDVATGKIKIKQAYNILHPPKVKEPEVIVVEDVKKEVEPGEIEEPKFQEIFEEFKDRATQIKEWENKLSEKPNLKLLDDIDTQLF